jgi:hypothetical protein
VIEIVAAEQDQLGSPVDDHLKRGVRDGSVWAWPSDVHVAEKRDACAVEGEWQLGQRDVELASVQPPGFDPFRACQREADLCSGDK